ncbi:GTPase Der OS=Streptomyces glaucescens OX=1907 GN=der PE=3 SV=1 [Streptomyces glaucescens]
MLDPVLEALPEAPAQTFGTAVGGPRRIALIGRPNVGKSSLLNKVAGEERVVVNELAGTTRDPVDEMIELGGNTWKFVDTAGIRKRVHLQQGADYYASLRTAAAVEKAEVAVVLIDASESISVQDQRIVTMAVEAGRAPVVAYNKWTPSTRSAATTWSGRSRPSWARSPGAPGSTSRRIPAATWRSWSPRSRPPSPAGRPGCRRAGQRLPRRAGLRPPAPRPGRQAAAHPLRHRSVHEPAAVRALRLRLHRGGLPPLHRAPAAQEFGFEGTPIHISVRVREKRGAKKKWTDRDVKGRPPPGAAPSRRRSAVAAPGRGQCRRDLSDALPLRRLAAALPGALGARAVVGAVRPPERSTQ